MHLAEHLVATTRGRIRRLLEPEVAMWLWARLATAAPDAFSSVLMVDHLHMMAPPGRFESLRRTLNRFTCRFGIRLDLQVAERATTPAILGRQMRYGFYNPVRSGAVDDPWLWPWSTLRDLGGACFPVWTKLSSVSRQLRLTESRALRALSHLGHRKAPAPRAHAIEVASTEALRHAVAGTLRVPPASLFNSRLGRRLTIQLADQLQRTVPTRDLAQILDIEARSVRRLRTPPHPALEAAQLCLGDLRLQRSIG